MANNKKVYAVGGTDTGILGVFTDVYEAYKCARNHATMGGKYKLQRGEDISSSYEHVAEDLRSGTRALIYADMKIDPEKEMEAEHNAWVEFFELNARYDEWK